MRVPKKFRYKPNSICPICQTAFYAEPNRIAKALGGQVFCSAKCFEIAGIGGRNNLQKLMTCKQCGKEVYIKNHRLNDGSNPQFCTKGCETKFRHEQASQRNTRVCAHCGREFFRDATSIRKTEAITGGKVYCSSVCSYAANGSRGKNRFEIDFHNVFPELAYTGDGSWVLHDDVGGMNPDFILPQTNKVIELFGNYWHANDNPDLRIDRLRKLGFETIVIWEDDFRIHSEITLVTVRNFLST